MSWPIHKQKILDIVCIVQKCCVSVEIRLTIEYALVKHLGSLLGQNTSIIHTVVNVDEHTHDTCTYSRASIHVHGRTHDTQTHMYTYARIHAYTHICMHTYM